jgi:hypothetical protein
MPPMDETTDPLEDRLRDERYLPDDGFTARTLQRLPGPRRSWRRWVLGTAALLSLVIAALLSPELLALIGRLGRTLSPAALSRSGTWSVAALAIAITITVVAVLALLREEA